MDPQITVYNLHYLTNGLFPALSDMFTLEDCSVRYPFEMGLMGLDTVNGQNVSLKHYSTEDNLSSLNDITKQFIWYCHCWLCGFLLPDSHLPSLSSLSFLIYFIFLFQTNFVTTRACVYIYILGVQFNGDWSSVKKHFQFWTIFK